MAKTAQRHPHEGVLLSCKAWWHGLLREPVYLAEFGVHRLLQPAGWIEVSLPVRQTLLVHLRLSRAATCTQWADQHLRDSISESCSCHLDYLPCQ